MSYWLLKTEPEEFSWDDQVARGAKGEPWTGVRNHRAKSNLKKMQIGDQAFFYHTGDQKQIVGVVEVIKSAYPDPTDKTGSFVAVTVRSLEALPRPVTLATVKTDPRLKDMALAKYPRLSVQPVTDREWKIVSELSGLFVRPPS
jgi:predicted RNA-binding protein with PUA-like domain